MKPKEIFSRFRAWYYRPVASFDEDLEEHRCANCGHVFKGNYCPVCRQEAGDGRVTWRSVWKNIVNVWGLDTRSFPNTLWRLMTRPGHHIGTYLSGHRQVSYSPANTLFLVALFYVVLRQLIGMGSTDSSAVEESNEEGLVVLSTVYDWMIANPGWSAMGLTMIMILPTWFLFRFAPRHSHHTLPEGIFIQIFMSTVMLVVAFVVGITSSWVAILIPIYYVFCYRQLFGYSLWGTLWRTLLCFIVWSIVVILLFCLSIIMDINVKQGHLGRVILFVSCAVLLAAAVVAVGYRISRRGKANPENS